MKIKKAKKQKNRVSEEERRYDFTRTDEDEKQDIKDRVESIEEHVDRLKDIKKLDEESPMERAIKYDYVRKNPPKKGFMKVETFKAIDDNGNNFVVSKSETKKGKLTLIHDVFRVVDLNLQLMADITKCPSHILPQLIDEYSMLAVQEKGEFKPEKAKEEFRWWWLLILLMMLPGIILVILMFIKG